MHPLSKANTTFSLALLRKLSEDNSTANIFFSPFSISAALAMLMMGARGNTASQISEVVFKCFPLLSSFFRYFTLISSLFIERLFTSSGLLCPQCLEIQDCQNDVHNLFSKLLGKLNQPGAPFDLSVANRLYGDQSYSFLQEFLTETRSYYNSEMESVDFRTSFEEARVKINSWVEEQTKGKIKDVVPQNMVDNSARIILVNALYFKGYWHKQFLRDDTSTREFRLNKRTTKPVEMMTQESKFHFNFISEVSCKILEMPYRGEEMSMIILLPKDITDNTTGLEQLEEHLTYEKLNKWTHPSKMRRRKISVSLPRFKVEENYDLDKVLSRMGMVDAFDETKCDFSGMSGNKELFLSKVSHKAFVEVNEEGTEAAAASNAEGIYYGFSDSASFYADHPFLFFIRHNPTLSILFAGRFCSPE
uniref:Serpin B6 n=1 Tax=Cyprinodon variegatus TaxID=28743 RepID=A0A3Q2CIU0_CYPVA